MPTHSLVAATGSPDQDHSGLLSCLWDWCHVSYIWNCRPHVACPPTGFVNASPMFMCLLCQNIPVAMIFCLWQGPRLFPGLLQVCHSPLRYLQQSNPSPLPDIWPQSVGLSSKPPLAASDFHGWKVPFTNYLCHEFSPVCTFRAPNSCSPLRFPAPLTPSVSGFSMWKFFLLQDRLLRAQISFLKSVVLFFFSIFIFCPTSFWIGLTSWKYQRSSAIIQKVFCRSYSTCR